jgi:hypothetical protein
MKWRFGFLLCCAVLISLAGATVASSQEVALICCQSTGSCPGGQLCCDAESVGLEPCEDSLANYCMEVCKRVAFTSDQR